MASEHVLEVPVRRHVLDTERPFSSVQDGIFGGISRPHIGLLFSKLVTILIQELPDGRTQVAYDTVTSAIAPYHDAAATETAQRLDTEVLTLLRQVTRTPGSGPA
jgi:hypothetical protein